MNQVDLPKGLFTNCSKSGEVRQAVLAVWQVNDLDVSQGDELSVSFASQRDNEIYLLGYGHSYLECRDIRKQTRAVHATFAQAEVQRLHEGAGKEQKKVDKSP
jgi:hypothetical protein